MAKAETYAGTPCKACGGNIRYAREKRCVNCRQMQDRARGKLPNRKKYDRMRGKMPHRIAAQKKRRESGYYRALERKTWMRDPRKRLLKKALERSRTYGREFTLVLSDIVVPECCPLLGIPLVVGTRQAKNNSPTVDRKDSTKGYVRDNIWVISWRANRIKSDSTLEELELIVKNWPVKVTP